MRLVEHLRAASEEVRESDDDELAVLRRNFLSFGQEDWQDLSEQSVGHHHNVLAIFYAFGINKRRNLPRLRLNSIEHPDRAVGVETVLLDRGGETDKLEESLRELVRL